MSAAPVIPSGASAEATAIAEQFVAARLALRCTPDYLSNVFSVATGEHLTAFINRQRIERAARLLRESALTSKEIAWACGFATQTYFIRTFRARMGITPKAWKAASAAPDATPHPTPA